MWTAETVLVCALGLLNRSAKSFPPIELVTTRPAYVSVNAEAYVLPDEARVYLLTATPAFNRARRATYRCGELQALRKIASVLIHEEWHVRNGHDENNAYQAQLAALIYLGAGPGNPLFYEVQRSMRTTTRANRRQRTDGLMANSLNTGVQ